MKIGTFENVVTTSVVRRKATKVATTKPFREVLKISNLLGRYPWADSTPRIFRLIPFCSDEFTT